MSSHTLLSACVCEPGSDGSTVERRKSSLRKRSVRIVVAGVFWRYYKHTVLKQKLMVGSSEAKQAVCI